MSWLLANVDIFKVTLIALSLAFFFLDVLLKGALRLSPESAGADLCLAAVSFDASILVDNFNKVATLPTPIPDVLRASLYVSFLLFLVDLVLWIVCLRLVAPSRETRLSPPGRDFTVLSHLLANIIGIFAFVLVVWLFVEV